MFADYTPSVRGYYASSTLFRKFSACRVHVRGMFAAGKVRRLYTAGFADCSRQDVRGTCAARDIVRGLYAEHTLFRKVRGRLRQTYTAGFANHTRQTIREPYAADFSPTIHGRRAWGKVDKGYSCHIASSPSKLARTSIIMLHIYEDVHDC